LFVARVLPFLGKLPDPVSSVVKFARATSAVSQGAVLLLLDEIKKYPKVEHLLSCVTTTLDGHGLNFFSLISTLDAPEIFRLATGSRRPISYIPLALFSFDASVSLFGGLLAKLDDATASFARQVISDCGGHPRSL